MKYKTFFFIILALAVLINLGPFLVPVPPLENTLPPRQLAGPDSRFIQVNGLDVHYQLAGQGHPAFILLHGFGASLFSWQQVMPHISQYGTVIAYDRPAFGLTERPLSWQGPNPYSPEAQVDLVIGLMDALSIEQAVLVGNSAGGTIALQTALAHPDRVSALVLVDAAVYAGGGAPDWIKPLLQTPQLDHIGPLIARAIQNRGDAFIQTAWHQPENIPPQTYQGYRLPLQAQHWDRALWELTVASRESSLPDRLGELSVPSLVITGDDDRVVPTAQSIRLAREIPGARLSVLENCGHLPQEECPAAFIETFADFFFLYNQ